MRTRTLGNTDLQLTTVGLGTWAIGGGDWKFGWGAQDEREAIDAIVRAVDLGINWIDTAAVYGGGRSEQLVGQALRRLGSGRRPIVATKCGRIFKSPQEIIGVIKRDSVFAECDASRRRLGVDVIDLYQLHWPDPDHDIEEAWTAMCDLKERGKVREIGVSNHSVAQMRRLQTIHPIASLQPPYSMIATDVEQEILPFCRESRIGVVCYSPMGKGLLTGSFSRQRAAGLDEGDHRSRDPKFAEPQLSINLELAESLREIAERHGRTVAQLAIAWVLRRPEVTSAIVGARRPRQIEATAPAANWELSQHDVEDVGKLLDARRNKLAALGTLDAGRV
jgi:aryl-alcohol dehydrogenase-like predicted oxidoreductase